VARHPIAAFLALVYLVYTATALVPPLADHAFPYDLPLHVAVGHLLGVAVPAFVVTWLADRREGVRDLVRRCTRWRVPLRWYVVALFSLPVAFLLWAIVALGAGPLELLRDNWTRVVSNVLPYLGLSILLFNVAEEVGWTGFFHARIQERHTPLTACAVVAFPFAVFHVPDFFVDEGWTAAQIGPAMAFLVFETFILFFARVILIWLYNNTGGSVLIVGLFHSSFNTTISRMSVDFLPDKNDGFWLASSIVIVTAVVIIVRTRGRLGYDRLAVSATP
jgi:membrane protease YdiL (CAAX protease family)